MEAAITWAALVGVGGLVITVVKFWLDFNDRIELCRHEAAKKIDVLRAEREKAGDDFNSQIVAMQASFHLYREQAAKESREYVTREMWREFEARVERATKDSSDRIFSAIGELSGRLDRIIEGRATTRTKR